MRSVLNISGHRVSPGVQSAIEAALGAPIRVRELSRHLDLDNLVADVGTLVDSAAISQDEWQENPPLVMLPTLGIAAAVALAELHGRSGFFPTIVWLQRDPGTGAYDRPMMVDLAGVRDGARRSRFDGVGE